MLQNTDFQKEKKGHHAVLQTNFFCDLASDLKKKKKKGHCDTDPILSAIFWALTKNKGRN